MQPIKIAVATHGFRLPLKKSPLVACDIGARGILLELGSDLRISELSASGRREFLHWLDELGLKVAAISLPQRRPLSDLQGLDERLAVIRAAMEFANQMRTNVLITRIGKIPADPASPEAELLRQIVSDLARHGDHVGGTLTVTPTHDTPETLREFVQSVKDGSVGIDLDPAGLVMTGQDPVKALRTLFDCILHVQARDGIRDIDGSGKEVPLGRGEVDWQEFVAGLAEIEYNGWVTAVRTQGDDIRGDLTRAVQYLKAVSFQ